jgi:hypothetical protein
LFHRPLEEFTGLCLAPAAAITLGCPDSDFCGIPDGNSDRGI